MGIKVKVATEKENKTIPFPKLMKSINNTIVLFSSEGIGVVIKSSTAYSVGDHNTCWDMILFEDYNEPITLQNE